jgi:hypothetical protein
MTAPSRDDLILSHLHLVHPIARRLMKSLPDQVEQEDVEGQLRLGLVQSAERWSAETGRQRGASFATFCRWRMVGAVLDWLRQEDMLPRAERRRVRAGVSQHFVEQFSPTHHDDEDGGREAHLRLIRETSREIQAGMDTLRAKAERALPRTLFVLWTSHHLDGVQIVRLSRSHGLAVDSCAELLERAEQTLVQAGVYAVESQLVSVSGCE